MTALRELAVLRDLITDREPEQDCVEAVAVELQALRRASLLNPADFAAKAKLSLKQLGFAEGGRVLPDREVVDTYLAVADAEVEHRRLVLNLWARAQLSARAREQAASAASTPMKPRPNLSQWPNPATLRDEEMFRSGLETVKSTTGRSYVALEQLSVALGYPLPKSTLQRMCTRAKLPTSGDVVIAFVRVCGGDVATAHAWAAAWQRLRAEQVRAEQSASGRGHEQGQGVIVNVHLGDAPSAPPALMEPSQVGKPAETSGFRPVMAPAVAQGLGTAVSSGLAALWSAMGWLLPTLAASFGFLLFGLGVLVGLVSH